MRRGQYLGRAVLGKLSARELYTCVLIFVPPRFSALQCQEENLLQKEIFIQTEIHINIQIGVHQYDASSPLGRGREDH